MSDKDFGSPKKAIQVYGMARNFNRIPGEPSAVRAQGGVATMFANRRHSKLDFWGTSLLDPGPHGTGLTWTRKEIDAAATP